LTTDTTDTSGAAADRRFRRTALATLFGLVALLATLVAVFLASEASSLKADGVVTDAVVTAERIGRGSPSVEVVYRVDGRDYTTSFSGALAPLGGTIPVRYEEGRPRNVELAESSWGYWPSAGLAVIALAATVGAALAATGRRPFTDRRVTAYLTE